ncbi:carboxymuconolactone decarboxylase family protein [Aquihabitans daechungensis]|uniref:carboxymuconolactone decarboxylase family protein n=1 Tax=Aquihabitans daechungensis TaxID=1052257 RepID=UPI003BA1561A
MTVPEEVAAAPRIAPGTRRDVGTVNWLVCRVLGRAGGTPPPNLFTTLGRHRGLFRGWLHFAGRLMPGGRLPRRETELVILRVAHLRSCTYEWEHHVRLGRRAGIAADEITRLEGDLDPDRWSEREAAILATVDELHATGDLTDAAWEQLRIHLDDREAIELLLLVGHYEMLATTLTALRIAPDPHGPTGRR